VVLTSQVQGNDGRSHRMSFDGLKNSFDGFYFHLFFVRVTNKPNSDYVCCTTIAIGNDTHCLFASSACVFSSLFCLFASQTYRVSSSTLATNAAFYVTCARRGQLLLRFISVRACSVLLRLAFFFLPFADSFVLLFTIIICGEKTDIGTARCTHRCDVSVLEFPGAVWSDRLTRNRDTGRERESAGVSHGGDDARRVQEELVSDYKINREIE
jgi:hypothetical protein